MQPNHPLDFLSRLEAIVTQRMEQPAADSYTARLVADGSKRIAQKVGEEAVELALASVAGDADEQIDEAADLVFHLLVLLRCNDLTLADVVARLEDRHESA